MYITVGFICIGFVQLWGRRGKQDLQNENFLPTVGIDPGTFRLLGRRIINYSLYVFVGSL